MKRNEKYFKGLTRRDYIAKANEIIHQEGIGAVTIRRIFPSLSSAIGLGTQGYGRSRLIFTVPITVFRISSVLRSASGFPTVPLAPKTKMFFSPFIIFIPCLFPEPFHSQTTAFFYYSHYSGSDILCIQNLSKKISVTFQSGLRIYCTDRMKA